MSKKDKSGLYFCLGMSFVWLIQYMQGLSKGEGFILFGLFYLGFFIYLKLNEIDHKLAQPTKYKVHFVKEIFLPGETILSKYRLVQNNVIMPFPPYPGLAISDWLPTKGMKKENPTNEEYETYKDFLSGKIEIVGWNNSSEVFNCEVEPFHMSEQNVMGAVLSNLKEWGWTVDSFDKSSAEKLIQEWEEKQNASV